MEAASSKFLVFVSSVQKELELERAAVAGVITTDPFLSKHCEPILFEKAAQPSRPASKPYLEDLRACQIYVLMVDCEYGSGDVSPTHQEYRLAQELNFPTLVLIKGEANRDKNRSKKTQEWLKEIKAAGHTYRRFHDREDLKPLVREGVLRLLKDEHGLAPSNDEDRDGEHQIESASPFEALIMPVVHTAHLNKDLLWGLKDRVHDKELIKIFDETGEEALIARGLAVRSGRERQVQLTRAAFLLFGVKPGSSLPQCELLLDAYDDTRITGQPTGQETINAPLLHAMEDVLGFVEKHTLHPRRVVGLNNLRLDEYPVKALREAVINALAHRDYADKTRKIMVRLFSDRLEIASPGYPLKPLTLARLRKGNYRPCSRNPLIAQTLAFLDHMEQRGTGFARMRDAMLDHGLDAPVLSESDGYFIVTLHGPNGNFDRLQAPKSASLVITHAIEARLNERQKKIMIEVQTSGQVTSGWCVKHLGVVKDTANRDLAGLIDLGLLAAEGKARAARYVLAITPGESSDNRPKK